MNALRAAPLLFVLSLLSGGPAMAQESLALIALRDWYAGISVDGHTEKGAAFKAFHAPDGRISAVFDGQHKNAGTWKLVEPGHVCITWNDPSWGKHPCYAVSKDGDDWRISRVDDPKQFTKVKRIEGNAFGL